MIDRIRLLYATAEAHPLAKTGGLGEVGGALPPALRVLGVDARLLLPAYPGVVEKIQGIPVGAPFAVLPGVQDPIQLFEGALADGTPVYAVGCPALYDREGGLYGDADGADWPDNPMRFAVLSKVAALFGNRAGLIGWTADIVHTNDWHTGLAPAYLMHDAKAWARSLCSIHNLAFQGNFPADWVPTLGLPWSSFQTEGFEFYGQLSFLKAGIYYADYVTTVSPTYAQEIQTPELGFGMEGLLAHRRKRLIGILNGIDDQVWNPATDAYLPARFSLDNLIGKAVNKQMLQERLGLTADARIPVLGMVARLTEQKGVDLILEIIEDLVVQPAQVVILGSGDRHYEIEYRRLARDYPEQVSVTIDYDVTLAHLIQAGSDLFLMPSRFEPCGLSQFCSMRYGTVPIVHRTGGLADSVVDTQPRTLANNTATGFTFENANRAELLACVLRALLVYRDQRTWQRIQQRGMQQSFGWDQRAIEYLKLYRALVPVRPKARV